MVGNVCEKYLIKVLFATCTKVAAFKVASPLDREGVSQLCPSPNDGHPILDGHRRAAASYKLRRPGSTPGPLPRTKVLGPS